MAQSTALHKLHTNLAGTALKSKPNLMAFGWHPLGVCPVAATQALYGAGSRPPSRLYALQDDSFEQASIQ